MLSRARKSRTAFDEEARSGCDGALMPPLVSNDEEDKTVAMPCPVNVANGDDQKKKSSANTKVRKTSFEGTSHASSGHFRME